MKNPLMLPPPPFIEEKRRLSPPVRKTATEKMKGVYTANEMWNRQRQSRSATDRIRPGLNSGYII